MSLRRSGVAVAIVICSFISSARADEAVLLKYKLAQGDKLIYRISDSMKQTQSVMGMKLENSAIQESIVSRVVDAVDGEGKATLKARAELRKLTAEFTGAGKFEFDSKSDKRDTGSQLGATLTPILERLTGSDYQLFVNPRGQVVEVKGLAELVADLIKDNPTLGILAGAGDNTAARLTEQEWFPILSEKPVAVGDKWEVPVDMELPKIGKLKGKTVFTCEGADKVGDRKTVRIGVTTDHTFELNAEQGGAKVSGTLTTTSSTGTVQFDAEAGRVVSIKRTFGMSGQLSVDVNGMAIPVDSQQEQTLALELLEKLP
jgi:hypothetical protein